MEKQEIKTMCQKYLKLMISELTDLEHSITDLNETNSEFDSKIEYTTELLCNYSRYKKQNDMGIFNICKIAFNDKSNKTSNEMNLYIPVSQIENPKYLLNTILDNISDIESEYEDDSDSDSGSDNDNDDKTENKDELNELDIKMIYIVDEMRSLKDSKYYN